LEAGVDHITSSVFVISDEAGDIYWNPLNMSSSGNEREHLNDGDFLCEATNIADSAG
jgi:hypothetical protein